ncbi:hypothetical protein [Mammaliicoccus vitulinus]|nr:hypothetical protein [Mammaliicoccus vitulinus]
MKRFVRYRYVACSKKLKPMGIVLLLAYTLLGALSVVATRQTIL